jgi:formate dehydrogenase alpha subunit
MNTSEEINKAKAILLVGSNITETNPVASLRVKAAIGVYKAQTIVVDSAQTNIAKLSSHPMMVKPGTEGLFVQGLVKSVIQQDLVDEETTQLHPEAFASLKQAVEEISLDRVAEQTGVEVDQIQEAAKIFAEASRSIILCGEGIVRHAGGYQNILNLIDLAWVTGKLGRPGCGISTLTEEANEQGALDMGVAPEYLPGLSSINDPAAREKFSSAWGAKLPEAGSHLHLMDIFERCRTGEIKALYIVGENPLATLPASFDVETALNNLDVLICQDPFMTETAKLAHVVFPACTFAEKDGTMTNQEGKVQYLRPAIDPLGESAVDWHIMVGLANGLDSPMEFETTHDIQKEIMKLLPGYYNLGHVKPGEPDLEAYLANGFAKSVQSRYACPSNGQPDQSFGLRMTQLLYHSGKLSTQASGLVEISPNTKRLRMIPEDMERLGLTSGDQVRMTSEKGTLELPVQADLSVMPGSCAFPEHFNDPPVKDLIPLQIDPDTGVPYFKLAHVTLEKI